MNLKQQVVSLDIAKRLKELGVKQKSLFHWNEGDGTENELEYIPEFANKTHELISAFTVAELGNLLPEEINVKNKQGNGFTDYQIQFTNGIHSVGYEAQTDYECFEVLVETIGLTEADARGKMLICLLENNLLT